MITLYFSRDSRVCIATGCGPRFDFRQGKRFFSSSQGPDRLWEPPSFLSNWYRVLFLRG
jgi:hypothetical protein